MTIRPVDKDQLAETCRTIALDNYGMLYVDKVSDEIISNYKNSDTGLLNADAISIGEVKETLENIANDDYSEFERLRGGVYYYDLFSTGNDDLVATALTNLFQTRFVVTSEELRSHFGIAIDDMDRFVSEMTNLDLIRRIAAGERDYYTVGPRLKEQAGSAGIDTRLRQKASHGKISHDQLERVINVAASEDVINYLEGQQDEGFIIDLEGEYLVRSAIDEFAKHVGGRIEEPIREEFEKANYLLPEEEFETVLRNEVEARLDVLTRVGPDTERDVVTEIKNALGEILGLTVERSLVIWQEPFDEYTAGEARRIKEEVETESETLPATPSEYMEAASESLDELQPSVSDSANTYVRNAVENQFEQMVENEFQVE